ANELVLEAFQTLGVETLQDLNYVQKADLVSVLRPTEARKLMARVKALSEKHASQILHLRPRSESQGPVATPRGPVSSISTPRGTVSHIATPRGTVS
ncbi:hypothetical protein AOLI_G00038110, partial [Acnodon oligacanthus]